MAGLLVGLVLFIWWGARLIGREHGSATPSPASPERVLELIAEAAASPEDHEAYRTCLGAMRMAGPEAIGQGLVRALESGSETERQVALYCAGEFASLDDRLPPLILEAASNDPTSVPLYALSRAATPDAVGRLRSLATSPEAPSYTAIWALAVSPDNSATEALLDILATHPDPTAGWVAAEAIGYRRDIGVYTGLAALLDTMQPVKEPSMIGERAAMALGYLGHRPALKALRAASHRLGDTNSTERLTTAWAICRLRDDSDYNFWLLEKAVKGTLPSPSYRPAGTPEFVAAVRLLVQLDDERVRDVLIAASQTADPERAQAIVAGFAALGVEPAWDAAAGGYVLRDLPPERAPRAKPWVLTPPWPFGDAR